MGMGFSSHRKLPSDDFCTCTRYKSMRIKGRLTSAEYMVCLRSVYEVKLSVFGGISGIASLNTVISHNYAKPMVEPH